MIESLESRVLLSAAVPALAPTYSGQEGPPPAGPIDVFDTLQIVRQHGRQVKAHAWGVPAAGDFGGRESAMSGTIKPSGAVTLSGPIRYWTSSASGQYRPVIIGRLVLHGVDSGGQIQGTYSAIVAKKWAGYLNQGAAVTRLDGTFILTPTA